MKNALITGASRGLGLALARQLAQQGWGLIIDARGKKALEQAGLELATKTNVIAIAGDVTAQSHRKKLLKAAQGLGGLDLIVNNASLLGPSPQPQLLAASAGKLRATGTGSCGRIHHRTHSAAKRKPLTCMEDGPRS